MNCEKIKKLSIKYEREEINFIEKKMFEKHLKKCDRCRNEYKVLLGLSFILKYSKKTYKPSLIEKIIPASLIKFAKFAVLASTLIFSAYQINNIVLKNEKEKIEKELKKDFQFNKNVVSLEEEKVQTKSSNLSTGSIKIISRENEKETEMFINKELEIKARLEN